MTQSQACESETVRARERAGHILALDMPDHFTTLPSKRERGRGERERKREYEREKLNNILDLNNPDYFTTCNDFMTIIYFSLNTILMFTFLLGVPYISANICCKSRNLPNTDIHNYSTDLR